MVYFFNILNWVLWMTYQDLFNNVLAFLSAILWIKYIIPIFGYMVFEKSSCLLLLVVELNNPAILFKPLQTTKKNTTISIFGFWNMDNTRSYFNIYNILSSITKTKKDISYPKSISCGGKKWLNGNYTVFCTIFI